MNYYQNVKDILEWTKGGSLVVRKQSSKKERKKKRKEKNEEKER